MPSSQIRETILDALDQLHCPIAHPELMAYVQAFHDVALSREDLWMLISQERSGYQAGEQRPVWICPAILNTPGFAADNSLLTRSDWPLTLRVVAAVGSEVIRRIWLTKRLCELASIALEQSRPSADVLIQAAATHAELLLPQGMIRARLYLDNEEAVAVPPFSELDWSVRLQFWAEAAEDAHADLADTDRAARQKCADELSQTSSELQLFGGPQMPWT